MKSKFHILPVVVCVLFTPAIQAQTTFSFQQGDLRKDGVLYGSGDTYAGSIDGHVTDGNPTNALTSNATAQIGNQFRANTNGQNFISLFSYDLTELEDFITANTGPSSSVTVTSVDFRLIASGNTSGTVNGGISLFRTDPFTSSATWATTDGGTAWSLPFQDLANETQYRFTGGGSALTANLGGTSPSTASKTAGSLIEWTSSAGFIVALEHALAQPDNTLYLMAARPLQNADGRVPFHTRSAATVDDRPELLVTVTVNSFSDWTGASDTSWTTAGNWTTPPTAGGSVRFNSVSIANLATELNQDFDLNSIALIDPSGPVSIGGTNTLTLGLGGIDLSSATQDLMITSPLILGAQQIWNINADRTLGIANAITGSGGLTIFGAGRVALGAADILPTGAGAAGLTVDGTLDLNGFSQTVNTLAGAGIVDNSAAGSATLTLGNNDEVGSFAGSLIDSGGALAVVKTGSGNLTLTGASSFSGGLTNHGTGAIYPLNNDALGTGPVVANGGTIYTTTANFTYSNALTLNNATLRVGGANNRVATWNGPVTVTGTSTMTADGGTTGITLGGTLDITGATFSTSGGTTHNINGDISGAGGVLNVNSGTLQLSGNNTYSGTTTLSGSSVLRLQATGTISSFSNIVINGTANFNVRNTVGWVYTGNITGEGTGQINLNSGTDAEIAGNISGVATLFANSTGTDTTVSGEISGPASVNVQGGILRLSGANSYSGATTLSGGSLVLAANDVLPDATAVIIGNATLNAATFTDTAGTLDITNTATINLGAGAALAFADSSAVDWGGGSLTLTGGFVSGSSLRFGTTSGGLTSGQLGVITAAGFENFALDGDGFLTADVAVAGYDAWAEQIADVNQRARTDDPDGDGFTNLEEFLFGTSPTAGNGSLLTTTPNGGDLVLRWLQRESNATYTLKQSATLEADSWTTVVSPVPALDADQTGAPADYDAYTVTLPTTGGRQFFRIEAVED